MSRYEVVPSANQWQVKLGSGYVVSLHYKKSRAVETARSEADSGDEVAIHRADGTIQERREY